MSNGGSVRDDVAGRAEGAEVKVTISEYGYSQVLEDAIAHADALRPPAGDPAWMFIGPRNVGGRVISLAQHPHNPLVLFVGTAHGGLWRTLNGGDTWERLGDSEHVFPVGCIAIHPDAPDTLYVATGALGRLYVSGRGIYRVKLAGPAGAATFEEPLLAPPQSPVTTPKQATAGAAFRYTRIRVDPDDPTRFWAASQSGLWRCTVGPASPPVPDVVRDFPDADGKPAEAPLEDTLTGFQYRDYCTDLLVARDPRESATVTVGGREVARYLILYVGISGVGVYRGQYDRKDDEVTWDDRLDVPNADLEPGFRSFRRVRLALCERQPNVIYAVFATLAPGTLQNNHASFIFRSDDNGKNWVQRGRIPAAFLWNTVDGIADYVLTLEVNPNNPDVLVCGEVDLCHSEDGAVTLTPIIEWQRYDSGDQAQHADQHAAVFDLHDRRRLWVGNDGGLSLARNLNTVAQSADYWRKRSHGIFAGQFQHLATSPALPQFCGGGLQDNGTFMSLGGPTWYHIQGGDGGGMAFELGDPRRYFSSTQNGIRSTRVVASDSSPSVGRTVAAFDLPATVAPANAIGYSNFIIDGAAPISGAAALFDGPVEQHPTQDLALLVGRSGNAFFTPDGGLTWPAQVGPLPAGENAEALCFGPVDANAVPAGVDAWVGTTAGNLFLTPDAAAAAFAPVPAPPWPGSPLSISRIAVHPTDRRIVAFCTDSTPGRAFLTYDRGRSWIDITEPVPTSIALAGAAPDLPVNHKRQFTARATYADGSVVDVTARAVWSSSDLAKATVDNTFGKEGHVTAVAVGGPDIRATLLGGAGAVTGSQALNVIAAAPPVPADPPSPARTVLQPALPPCPCAAIAFDPGVGPLLSTRLLVGTLAGVYALENIPVVVSLTISPAGPIPVQTNAPLFQLKCFANFSDGSSFDISDDVDWSSDAPASATVDNSFPTIGQVTPGGAVGAANITANRGTVSQTVTVNVQGAATPAPPGPAVAPGPGPPPLPIAWRPFGRNLPLALVTDFARVGATSRLRACTFGLGCFEIDTAAAVRHRLFIRQTVIEDGHAYPRAIPALVPDDPRVPAGLAALDFTHAFDIRVDAPPYSFFDDVVDGVEFDERMPVNDAVPFAKNFVYVQVHNSGFEKLPAVDVHLYFRSSPVPAPIGPAAVAIPPGNGLGAVTDFYRPGADFDADPASAWRRIGKVTVRDVTSGEPVVARFAWIPDATLAGTDVALLALCTTGDGRDDLPAAPSAGPDLDAFIPAERRAALRIVHVGPHPGARIFLRDAVADDTRIGIVPFGGRSPDILVVVPDITDPAAEAFKDLLVAGPKETITDLATGLQKDVLIGGTLNVIYVRVHSRSPFQSRARVMLFAVKLDEANLPDPVLASWTQLPDGAPPVEVDVPANGVAYARIEWNDPDDPRPAGDPRNYLLVALIESVPQAGEPADVLPVRDRVTDVDALWQLITRFIDADNAATRAVHWESP